MTAINFSNALGQIDLNLIRDEDVAALDDTRKALIHRVIETVMARIKADQHLAAARTRVKLAMADEDKKLAAHAAVNPVPTFADIRNAAIAAYSQK
jgi:hypothetical protein